MTSLVEEKSERCVEKTGCSGQVGREKVKVGKDDLQVGIPGQYLVYLGTSEDRVAAASGFGSPLLIGTSTENTLPFATPLAPGSRYFWRVDAGTRSGLVKGVVHFFDLPFQSTGNPILQPRGTTGYSDRFGRQLSAGPDGLLVSEANKVLFYTFEPETGDHEHVQTILGYGDSSSAFGGAMGESIATGPGLLIAGNDEFNDPVEDAGAAFIHRPTRSGTWSRTTTLPDPPLEGVSLISL